MEETSRCLWQLVIHVDITTASVFARVPFDLERKIDALVSCIGRWKPLLTPAEDDELLSVFFRDLIEESPKVFDKSAIPGVIGVVFGILSVTAQECYVWLAATADPRL